MNMRLAFFLSVFSFFLFDLGLALEAQPLVEREWLAIHPRVGLGYTSHSATITSFEGVADCGLFDHGSSTKPQFSLSLETPLSSSLYLGLGFRYTDRSVDLFSDNTTLPSADVTKPGGVVNVVFENSIVSTLQYVDIMPELRYHVSHLGKAQQRLGLGFIAAFNMNARFNQQQRIVSPENVVYTSNNQQTVSLSNGEHDISTVNSMLMGVSLSVENLLPVGKSSFFTQQLSAETLFSDIVNSAPWKAFAIRADIGFRFSLQSSPEIPVPPVPAPPPTPKKDSVPPIVKNIESPKPLPILQAKIEELNAYLQTGNELRATTSLVNAVFFDQNNAVIPPRYIQKRPDLIETDDALEYHRAILFSVANIMKNNPKATIVLEGATSGSDESGALTLAKQRADNVQSALIACGVEADRISTRATVLPRIASNSDYAQGREENRRVDILLTNAPLQEYVSRQQYVQLLGTAQVNVEAHFFESGEIRVQSPAFKDYLLTESQSRSVDLSQRLNSDQGNYTFEISAHAPPFLNSRDERTIDLAALRRERIVLNLKSFDAILRFDYNSSEFSQANKELLRQLVSALPEGSTIQIIGSADALGDEASNRQLSERRASSTENFIKSISASKFQLESSVSTEKFDESRPEGRFLNRNIRIRVRE